MLHTIDDALAYIEEAVIGGKKWTEALAHPRQRVAYLQLRTRKAFNFAGSSFPPFLNSNIFEIP